MKTDKTREKGQTLIVAVLAIIVLFLAALFLFDLQSIIRIKVKTQTAADAAALAGAKMQVESLNLIGEINLIKACTVLVSDYSMIDTPEALQAASDNLTEMQARITFVGPILGIGAAQQAAKNNGMIPFDELSENFSDYLNAVENDAIYGNEEDFPPVIEGYTWREPYIEMLRVLNNQGMAAGPNMDLPEVHPAFWLDSSLYDAINSEFWCHDTLRMLIKNDSNFVGQWWQGLVESVSFIEESELMPLYVRYRTGTSTFNNALPYLNSLASERSLQVSDLYDKDEPEDTDGINTPIPYMRWCCYDHRWSSHAPGENWTEESSILYLRRGLKPEYQYGGAISYYQCKVNEASWLSGSYKVHNISNQDGVISSNEPENPVVESTAAAKPLGALDAGGTPTNPTAADMILPVFTGARLTPVAMPPADSQTAMGSRDYTLYQFLKWLDTVNDIDNPETDPPSGSAAYLSAMQKLNDPLWRHSGWNPAYTYTPPGPVVIYDPSTDTGAGRLQEPTGNPDIPGSDGYIYDEDGEIVGINYTQDDLCDWGPPGGGVGGVGRGGGGPGQLH